MEKLAIPCQCGCSVVVFIEFDAFKEDPQEFYAEFYTMVCPSLKERFKTTWKVFRGKDHYLHDLVLDKNALAQLQEFLNRKLPIPSAHVPSSHGSGEQPTSL